MVDAYDSLNNLRPTEANLSDVSAWVSSGDADRLWSTYAAIVLPSTPTPKLWSSSSKLQRGFVQWLASPLKNVATDPKAEAATSKPVTHVIPPVAILLLGAALETGAKKYGVMNWRGKKIKLSVYTDAIDRHLLAFRDGHTLDSDSGLHHLAHVMAGCAIILDAAANGGLDDDRSDQCGAGLWVFEDPRVCGTLSAPEEI